MRELLLITFDGYVHGVWSDEVLSVEELRSLHHLPISPASIAGVSIVHDRTVTLADLSVCVGHAPLKRGGTGHVLVMSDTKKFAGFVVAGDIRRVVVGPEAVHPIPNYLKTPAINSCVIVNSLPIPVINIPAVYDQILKTDCEPPSTPLVAGDARLDIARIQTIRIFEINGERFAASVEGMEEQAITPGHITKLAQTRPFVIGVVLHHGRILTVIDLLQRLAMRKTDNGEKMLVVELGNALFGFLVHADGGTLHKEDFLIKALPPIARSGWLYSAIIYAGKIMPLLDLGAFMSSEREDEKEQPFSQRYAPDPAVIAAFGREDIEVVEFSLLGRPHALPKSEVKDIIGFKPYREIPNEPGIVIGVAEHNEELLPVLDLAMVFGRRSLVTPAWRMLHIESGDFHALVIVEVVFGERQIPRDLQRALPIVLPHHVVYGCYTDADSVRLILNVEALVVYFEKALVQELLSAMTPEMKQARAELVPSLLGELAPSSFNGETEEIKEQPLVHMEAAALQPVGPGEVLPAEEQPEALSIKEALAIPEAEEVQKPEEISGPLEELQEPMPAPSGEEVVPEAHEEGAAQIEVREPQVISEPEQAQEEELIVETVLKEGGQPAEELHEEVMSSQEKEALREETSEQPQISVSQEETATMEPLSSEIVEKAEPVSEEPTLEIRPSEVHEEAEPVLATPVEAAEAEEQASSLYYTEPPLLYHEQKEEKPIVPTEKNEEASSSSEKWKFRIAFGILVAVLVLAVLLWQMETSQNKKAGQAEKPAATAGQRSSEPPASMPQKEPLVLTVPTDVKLEIDKYIVKKGDTLWDISKRFTGSPFNYPGIAGENKILDPDLIYPEQKIIIKKKEK